MFFFYFQETVDYVNKCWKFIYANPAVRADIQVGMEMNWAGGKDLSCKLKYWNVPRNPVLSKLFQAIWLDKLNEFAKRSALDVSISCWRYFTSLEIFVFQTEWTSRWGALPLPRVEAKLFSRKVQLRIKRYFYSPWCKRAKIFGLNCSWLPYSTYLYLDFHLDDIDILQKKMVEKAHSCPK